MTLNGCGSAPVADKVSGSGSTAPQSRVEAKADRVLADARGARLGDKEARSVAPMPQKPQLVKTAELFLRLESIDKMMVKLRQIVQSKQGDIYNFQDDRSPGSGEHRQATLTLKVPSNDAFGVQVQETWKNSTHAAGSLVTNLASSLNVETPLEEEN